MILENKKVGWDGWNTEVHKYGSIWSYLFLIVLRQQQQQQQHRNLSMSYDDMYIYRLREQFGSSSNQLIWRSFA